MIFLYFVLLLATGLSAVQAQPASSVYRFDVASLFDHEHISSIAIDNRGLSYFAVTQGILEFDGVEWRRIGIRNSALISLLTVNNKGRIYAGGRDEFGFLAVDDKGNTIYESVSGRLPGSFSGEIVAIVPSGDDVYYFAPGIMYRWDGTQVDVVETAGRFLSAATAGGLLYAMDENRGLVVVDSTGTLKPVAGGAAIRSRILAPVNDNSLLVVSASRGYFRVKPVDGNPGRLEPWGGASNGLPVGSMITSVSSAGPVLAFGTLNQGVLFTDFDGNVLDRTGRADGLFADLVLGVTFTARHTLWTGHDNGVSLIEAHSRIPALADALPASMRMTADTVAAVPPPGPDTNSFWSGITGFFSGLFTPADTTTSRKRIESYEFAAIVRRVQFIQNDSTVFGGAFAQERLGIQDFEQSDSIRYVFEPDENALRFSFATNDFESSGGIQYQAFLEGLDEDWSPLTDNTFREYTNLDFGSYVFKVRAINRSGQMSREASFRFEIDPPWHQALWFYFLQIFIYLSLLVSSYFLNRRGIALGFAEKIVTILVVVTFEYINTYLGPIFDEIAGDIAVFAVAINIVVALVLDPVQGWYEDLLKLVAKAQKDREDRIAAEKQQHELEEAGKHPSS